ncbi:TPA: PilZ domain-containing protein [Aeromonas hydrophila]|uniref:PilZ domain-containing protein n=1 Tax=Aeromonas hydrophila TaxID=644 RepID=UPI001CCFEFE4|nr:PilZ domain-containing protein [Aeromonas hydrophila]MCR3949769.1 PilZ domain-containing protein [Aeromonas hydrophila]MCW4615361.1 PilZ domain-containing protein [Aeromonas hydrophila]UBQ50886.1 PilZ domain-containing protein [Aeromonas hydrophila]UCM59424.1 PilZ domain-containing protein [Aeromonas hydrophila]HDI1213763.1 PilZ domain-containing protein [Aeromonas hydrophila]
MQEQFFSVTHATPVNVIPMPGDFHLPSLEALEAELPEPFRIASAITSIDMVTSRLIRNQNDSMHDLVEIINQQSRKIDMIMGYVLSVQDHPEHRFHTLRFGAGQLTYLHPRQGHGEVPHLHQIVRLKIFLREEASAIYCYGQVKQLEPSEHGTHVMLDYVRIREDDRELLVRASLHVQSKQLKLRAQDRQR